MDLNKLNYKLCFRDFKPASLSGLVDGALVQVAPVLLVLSDGLERHDGHLRVQLLQSAVSDGVQVHIPPGAL